MDPLYHLTAAELAARWKMHPVHIRRIKNTLPYVRIGRKILFPVADIVAFEEKNRKGVVAA